MIMKKTAPYILIVTLIVTLMLIVVTIFQILYTRSLINKISKVPPKCDENGSSIMNNANTMQVYLIDINKDLTKRWNDEATDAEILEFKNDYISENSRLVKHHPYSCSRLNNVVRTTLKTEFNNPEYIVFEGSPMFIDVILSTKFDYMVINGVLYYVVFDKKWNLDNAHKQVPNKSNYVLSLFNVNTVNDNEAQILETNGDLDTNYGSCVREQITTFNKSNVGYVSITEKVSSSRNRNLLVQAICIPSISK